MKIYLIGYMGSGKTTVGKRLAKLLEYRFVDLDQMFEERYRLSVPVFFERYDENAFRKIEEKLIQEVSLNSNLVVSTGGGAPCYFNNMKTMTDTGVVVYLQMAVKSLLDRLSNAKTPRPILKNLSGDDLRSFIENQLSEREKYYKKANITVQGESINVNALAETIRQLSFL